MNGQMRATNGRRLAMSDLLLVVLDLFFLAAACFMPFAAALLSRYPTNPAALLIAVARLSGTPNSFRRPSRNCSSV